MNKIKNNFVISSKFFFTKVRNLLTSVEKSKKYLSVNKFIKDCYVSFTWSVLYIVLAFAVFYLFMNVKNLITIAESGTIITATLTVLIFTYASVLRNDEHTAIIEIGECFLKSTVNFIIGIIFLIGSGKTSDSIFNSPPLFPPPINIILYFIAYVILIVSIVYFIRGITNLLKKLYE